MMTKVQNTLLNYIAIIIVVICYVVLKIHTNFNYLQIVQKTSITVMFLSGLVLAINNLVFLKQTANKIFTIILLIGGLIITIWSGVVLYLILALQNTGF